MRKSRFTETQIVKILTLTGPGALAWNAKSGLSNRFQPAQPRPDSAGHQRSCRQLRTGG